jgi:1-pyrroline-4-hydroxy-2-carboxylate deaminase
VRHITSGDEALTLMVGVDTQVVHGFVNCGATGAITGIGNALPKPVLQLVSLCQSAQHGDADALRRARELSDALTVLSTYDEGPDLVLYYKYLLELSGDDAYRLHFNASDELSASQRAFAKSQFEQFQAWYANWQR